jgi:two-component system NtrC family sensor kinase
MGGDTVSWNAPMNYAALRSGFDARPRIPCGSKERPGDSKSRHSRQNKALSRLARSQALGDGNLEVFQREVTESGSETLGVARCSIWLYASGNTAIRCADLYQSGAREHSKGFELAEADFPNYFRTLNVERVIAAHDAKRDPRTAEFSASYLTPLGITSMLDAPIHIGGRMIGVICLEHVGPRRHWSSEDQSFAGSLADLLALGMEIAERHRAQRLLEEYNRTLEQRVEERTRELREKQAQLVQSEKMAALGNLVAGIVHEINNPLAALSCSSDTVSRLVSRIKVDLADCEQSPEALEPARLSQLLEQIGTVGQTTQAAAHRIMGIVSSLRSFAALDRATQDRVDIHEGLESCVTLLQHLLAQRITLQKDYSATPPITCRPSQLNQVFMNLLVNAVEAIQHSGDIVIRTCFEDPFVAVEISDTGAGITPESLCRIFDPGFTTKGVKVGTGLGLAIAHRIVEQHHGKIEVESEPGKGSTFRILLPL